MWTWCVFACVCFIMLVCVLFFSVCYLFQKQTGIHSDVWTSQNPLSSIFHEGKVVAMFFVVKRLKRKSSKKVLKTLFKHEYLYLYLSDPSHCMVSPVREGFTHFTHRTAPQPTSTLKTLVLPSGHMTQWFITNNQIKFGGVYLILTYTKKKCFTFATWGALRQPDG